MRAFCLSSGQLVSLLCCILPLSALAQDSTQCMVKDPNGVQFLESLNVESDLLDKFIKSSGESGDQLQVNFDGTLGLVVDDASLPFVQELHRLSSTANEFLFYGSACFELSMLRTPICAVSYQDGSTIFGVEYHSHTKELVVCYMHQRTPFCVSFSYEHPNSTTCVDIVVVMSGRMVTAYADCQKIADHIVDQPQYNFPPDLVLEIGQTPFKGKIYNIGISFSETAVMMFCPDVRPACTNCGPYLTLLDKNTILKEEVTELAEELKTCEENSREEVQLTCFVDGKQHEFNTFFWRLDDPNMLCFCSVGGTEHCVNVNDATLENTPTPITASQVAPTASSTDVCAEGQLKYEVGDSHYYKDGNFCFQKICRRYLVGGFFELFIMDDVAAFDCNHESFQRLRSCENSTNWSEDDKDLSQCCGFCTACQLQQSCSPHATCSLYQLSYVCNCKRGFTGNGLECTDINECLNGYIPDYGHYCPTDAECINTDGGFECKCADGYWFDDLGNFNSKCRDIDECTESPCGDNALCINEPGSYSCTCKDGYIMRDDECIPDCDPSCANGGTCVAPNKCECVKELTGTLCQQDIDECREGTHECSLNAECVNIFGGHFCICKPGYRGTGKVCTDIDECAEGTDDCVSLTTCVNTDGGYNCSCDEADNCRGWCYNRHELYPDGSMFFRGGKNCNNCTCQNAVVTCLKRDCYCGSPEYSEDCCDGKCVNITETGECEFQGSRIMNNEEVQVDRCISVICQDNKLQVVNKTCELPYPCPSVMIQQTDDGCCEQCKVAHCTSEIEGQVEYYDYGCGECTCMEGSWTCALPDCPAISCPRGEKLVTADCCPACDGSSADLPLTGTEDSCI